jgi:hypothetical protein
MTSSWPPSSPALELWWYVCMNVRTKTLQVVWSYYYLGTEVVGWYYIHVMFLE